jgi:tetratricopeptide (TPR) repeat protein
VLLLCVTRPELFEDHPGWHVDDVRLTLEPLPDDVCDRLIDTVLASASVDPAIRAHVRASAEGNPLFVEEMLATLREDGVLLDGPTGWTATRQVSRDMIPSSIQAMLRARLERLTGDQQTYIEVASVVGRVFWQSAVAELARRVVGGRAADHLIELVQRDLITPDVSVFAGDHAFRFRHILLRDAAYSALSKASRAEAHEQFADWLTRAVGDRAADYDEILGYHLERAFELRSALSPVGERERDLAGRAGARLGAAGTRSFASGDIAAALNLLGRAHALLAVDPSARLRLVPTLSLAMSWRGDPKGGTALLAASILESAPLDDPALTMHLRLSMAAEREGEDSPTQQEEAARQALAVFSETSDDEGLAQAWMLMGLAQHAQGRAMAAEESWTQALAPARRGAPLLAEETELWLASYCVYGPTHIDEVADRLKHLSDRIGGKPYREGTLLRGRAFVAAARKDFPTAYRLVVRCRETYDDLGLDYPKALASQTAYEVALRAGELSSVIPSLEEDERALASMGDHWSRSTTAAMLAHATYADERLETAHQWAELARDLTSPGDTFSEVLWRTAAAKLLARSGRQSEALTLAVEAVTLVRSSDWLCTHADALLDQAEVLALGGRTEDAAVAVMDATKLYSRKGDDGSILRTARVLDRLRS